MTDTLNDYLQRWNLRDPKLLANPQDECVLHGDIQHHNIRRHPANLPESCLGNHLPVRS